MPTVAEARKPHRQFCSVCAEVDRVMFLVPNEIWELATHESQRHNLICLACFTKMADERGVEWDKDIKFYPKSQITQNGVVMEADKYEKGANHD